MQALELRNKRGAARVGKMNRWMPNARDPSLCSAPPPGWLQPPRTTSSRIVELAGRTWRYFTAVRRPDGTVRLLFKDGVEERFVGSIGSRDGIKFDASDVAIVLNSSWHRAHMTHNVAIAPSQRNDEYFMAGGQYNQEIVWRDERPNDGVWLTRWRPGTSARANSVASAEEALLLLNGSHRGCIERRVEAEGESLYPGANARSRACEFDGRLSLVFHRGRWLLYARANPTVRGHRHVQVARSNSDQLRPGDWGPFKLVRLRGYDFMDGDIYYFLVQQNPVAPGTLLATFPLFHGRSGCTAIASSLDGVHWSPPTPLVPCRVVDRLNGRTLCHPSNLVTAGRTEVALYTHDSVPIDDLPTALKKGGQQPAPSLAVHRIATSLLLAWTQRSIAAADNRRRAGANLAQIVRRRRTVRGRERRGVSFV